MQERIPFIDYIRVIACLLVMVVHASECFYVDHDSYTMVANESNRLWVPQTPCKSLIYKVFLFSGVLKRC